MRRLVIACGIALASGTVGAQQRASTLDLSCDEARTLVASKSAVVLSTGGRGFDRYFASRIFCSMQNQDPVSGTAPTSDDPSCEIGYICRPRVADR